MHTRYFLELILRPPPQAPRLLEGKEQRHHHASVGDAIVYEGSDQKIFQQ
jgi:hypothetical protein